MKQDNQLLISLYQKWVPRHLTPAEFSYFFIRNPFHSYLLGLAELASQRIITISPDYRFIIYPKNMDDNPLIQVLNACVVSAPSGLSNAGSNSSVWQLSIAHLETYATLSFARNLLLNLKQQAVMKARQINDNDINRDISQMQKIAAQMTKSGTMPFVDFSMLLINNNIDSLLPLYYYFQKDYMQISPDTRPSIDIFSPPDKCVRTILDEDGERISYFSELNLDEQSARAWRKLGRIAWWK
ncbi:MAG: hypothetical protein IJ419_07250 [Agathobacter sp.]|nr:hypothetical protein [Agathobacter sp.]